MNLENKNILISGAGIAGTTLAFWLKRFCFNPTIVEHASKLRKRGYAIDFWSAGFDVAERMGIIADLDKAGLGITELSIVDENSKRKTGLNYPKLKKLMKAALSLCLAVTWQRLFIIILKKTSKLFSEILLIKLNNIQTK